MNDRGPADLSPEGPAGPASVDAGQVLFREVQRFRQWWIRWLIAPLLLGLIALFLYGMVQQLGFGRPWGGRPLPDAGLVGVGLGALLVCGAVLYILLGARLVTEVRPDGLYVRFRPLHLRRARRIGPEQVIGHRSVRYHPILEYGGWGIRWRPGGWAYNVYGDGGVRLLLADGSDLLVGSQRPEALDAALSRIMPPDGSA